MSETEKTGLRYAYGSLVLWAFFPVLTVVVYRSVPVLLSLTITTACAALFFLVVIVVRKKTKELTNPLLLRYALFITLATAVGFYGLYFLGLTYTTPNTASIIGLFEVCTSFLFFNVFHKESFSREHTLGAILMIVGACLVLFPKGVAGINSGAVLILLATFCAPLGNKFQQKARKIASGETIMFLRNALAAPCFLILAILFKQTSMIGPVTTIIAVSFFVNALLVFGMSKLFFVEAIHRISVTRVIALGSMAPFLTILISWIFFGTRPELLQITALIPLSLGVLFLTDTFSLHKTI